jgi:inorganic triphosphatase YgiF
VFPALVPCFVTDLRRTSWSVRRRDGSIVEVSLDVGQIEIEDKSAPVCELELKLIAGQPAALFDIAQQIAQTIAVIPASMSTAERGYRLATGTLDAPMRAQIPVLTPDVALPEVAQRVLREMFNQFTSNLQLLLNSDDAEVVHQARIGWRRFKSALRLFRPVLAADAAPSWEPLQLLQTFLGELRDLDVALIETLPPLRDAFAAGNPLRLEKWQALTQALTQAATLQRKSVKYALMDPAVGAALLSIAHWLEELSERLGANDAMGEHEISVRRWARRRITRLHEQLRSARKNVDSAESLHRVRILAKRLRYGIEALRPLLPQNRAQRWCERAAQLQASVGSSRDVMQACALASRLEVDSGVVEFLRGFYAGQKLPG